MGIHASPSNYVKHQPVMALPLHGLTFPSSAKNIEYEKPLAAFSGRLLKNRIASGAPHFGQMPVGWDYFVRQKFVV
jgi:hypothetical protein